MLSHSNLSSKEHIYIYIYFKDPPTNILIFRYEKENGLLTCNWRAVPWDAAEVFQSNVEIPRTRCRPFCGEPMKNTRRGVDPEGGRDGLEESCSSTPGKQRQDVARVRDDDGRARTLRRRSVTSPYWFLRGGRRASDDFPPPGNRTGEADVETSLATHVYGLPDLIFQPDRHDSPRHLDDQNIYTNLVIRSRIFSRGEGGWDHCSRGWIGSRVSCWYEKPFNAFHAINWEE